MYFFHHVEIIPNGCWIWWGRCTEDGYGMFGTPYKRAHRVAYEIFKGAIPDGLQIDHLCRVRRCVNPEHLEAVTSKENTLRGETITGLNAQKTHCPQGHPLEGDNLYLYNGKRSCKECRRNHTRKRRNAASRLGKRPPAYMAIRIPQRIPCGILKDFGSVEPVMSTVVQDQQL
jgi:hypothetical protein